MGMADVNKTSKFGYCVVLAAILDLFASRYIVHCEEKSLATVQPLEVPVPAFKVKILGKFALLDEDGSEIPVRSKKLRALLAYLALNPDQRHDRKHEPQDAGLPHGQHLKLHPRRGWNTRADQHQHAECGGAGNAQHTTDGHVRRPEHAAAVTTLPYRPDSDRAWE